MAANRCGKARQGDAASRSLFTAIVCFLVTWVTLGGAAPTNVLVFIVLAISGSAMAAMCVAKGGARHWLTLSRSAQALVVYVCMVPLLQLIPLPSVLWHALPGHTLAISTLETVGIADRWRPITMSVDPTFRTSLILLWLTAFLCSLLQLSEHQWHRLFGVLLALGLLNVVIGIVQVVSRNPDLQIYDNAFFPYFNGLFANKNHTGLFIVLTFLAGYAWFYGPQGWDRRRLAFVIPVSALMTVALFLTFSRAVIVMAAFALCFLVAISGAVPKGRRTLFVLSLAAAAGIVVLAIVSSSDVVSRSFARFGGVSEDERWQFARWSWPLVGAYFPFGAGVGAFTAVFPSHEQLSWVKPTYVNHVHDDFIEQLIEVGIAAPVGWLLAVAVVVRPCRTAWATRMRLSGRLGMIAMAMIFLMVCHSAVDYPLRRPAIAVTFMMALAALLRLDARVYRGDIAGKGRVRRHSSLRPTDNRDDALNVRIR